MAMDPFTSTTDESVRKSHWIEPAPIPKRKRWSRQFGLADLLWGMVWCSLIAMAATYSGMAAIWASVFVLPGLLDPSRWVGRLCSAALVGMQFLVLVEADSVRQSGLQGECRGQLQQITLAVMQYESSQGRFPTTVVDAQGRPRHSWRVLILPYLNRQDVYEKYRFDEPWNGPNNRKLAPLCSDLFRCPANPDPASSHTNYLMVVGPDSYSWVADQMSGDPPADKALLVEVANSGVHWMEPADITVAELEDTQRHNARKPSNAHSKVALVSAANGSTFSIPMNLTVDEIHTTFRMDKSVIANTPSPLP